MSKTGEIPVTTTPSQGCLIPSLLRTSLQFMMLNKLKAKIFMVEYFSQYVCQPFFKVLMQMSLLFQNMVKCFVPFPNPQIVQKRIAYD